MHSARMAVSFQALIAVYALVPLLVLIAVVDQLFFSGWLQTVLPQTPDDIFLYALLFNIPHHIASLFWLGDLEYLEHYKKRLILLPFMWVFFLALLLWSPLVALFFFVIYTEYHTISQQGGIACALMRSRPLVYQLWRILAIAIFFLSYLVYYPGSFAFIALSQSLLSLLLLCTVIVFIGITAVMVHISATEKGRWYMGAASTAVVVGYLLLVTGYPLLSIFLSRAVHDITAFIFYIVHDSNRFYQAQKNVLYRGLSVIPFPVAVVLPVCAIVIGLLVSKTLTATVLLFLFITHYYVESFIWKRASMHRTYADFRT